MFSLYVFFAIFLYHYKKIAKKAILFIQKKNQVQI